jgi:hypothetical protein
VIVSCDVAYNHCHMYVGSTTADSRAEWIAALDKLAALHPAAVVTSHKSPTQGNLPAVPGESRGYIEYYGQLREAGPDRPWPVRRHGGLLSRLGQPHAIPDTRLRNPKSGSTPRGAVTGAWRLLAFDTGSLVMAR